MNLWTFLMELVMLLGAAFLLGALAQLLRQSPILGYLLAGTIVGPLIFNASAVNQTAELGVSLLLFSIGLEFSFQQLRRMGRMAFGGGAIQVIGTLVIAALIMFVPTSMPQALTIGAIVALSSTTLVLRLLVDRAEIDSIRGRASLGILLLQDIAILPLILMVSLLSPAAPDAHIGTYLLKIILSVIGLFVVLYVILHYVAPRLLSTGALFANRELTVLLAITVGLGSTWAAHAVNISPALGAFVAGMLLGESPFATQIRADVGSLRIIMVTLFFASVGMLAKPSWFISHLHWILPAALGVFILKTTVIYGVTRLFGLNNRQAIATGIILSQVGEFSFVLATSARDNGILDSFTIDLIISVIILLMLTTPYLVALANPLAYFLTRKSPADGLDPNSQDVDSPSQVLIVGLGPAGRQVVQTLVERKLALVAIEMNPRSQEYARENGITVHLGDATQEDVLLHAGLANVCMAVVTLPDPATSIRVIRMLRRLKPNLHIAARCRYNRHLEDLIDAGADMVVDEENTMGKILSARIIETIDTGSGAVVACRLGGQSPEVFPGDAVLEVHRDK